MRDKDYLQYKAKDLLDFICNSMVHGACRDEEIRDKTSESIVASLRRLGKLGRKALEEQQFRQTVMESPHYELAALLKNPTINTWKIFRDTIKVKNWNYADKPQLLITLGGLPWRTAYFEVPTIKHRDKKIKEIPYVQPEATANDVIKILIAKNNKLEADLFEVKMRVNVLSRILVANNLDQEIVKIDLSELT